MAEKRNIFLVGALYGCREKHYWAPVSSTTQYMEFYDSDQEIEKRTGADVGLV